VDVKPCCFIGLASHRYILIIEANVSRNASVNRFKRTCEFCMHVYKCKFVHDAFHILFECPLFSKERNMLFQRVPPQVVRDVFGIQFSLHELHIMLLCPPTIQIASAVGYFLACTIAKLGIFKTLKDAAPANGSMNYMQCINTILR